MKNIFAILALMACYCAHAQFLQQGINRAVITNAAVFQVNGGTTTNLTAGQKKVVALGGNGFAFMVQGAATNTVVTTNLTFRFEFSQDNTNWNTTFFPTFITAPNGTTAICEQTNFPIDLVRNFNFVRLKSIQNTNAVTGTATNADFWITNMVFTVR